MARTQKEINEMKSLIAQNKDRLGALLKDIAQCQQYLHACKTQKQIDECERDLRGTLQTADELLANVAKMQKQIAEWYSPATPID